MLNETKCIIAVAAALAAGQATADLAPWHEDLARSPTGAAFTAYATIPDSAKPLVMLPPTARSRANPKADVVIVKKSERRLYLYSEGEVLRVYRVSLGRRPSGHKLWEGDGRTPEGRYELDWRNANSQYYRSIHISYPSAEEIAAAEIRGDDPGGMIMIHGLPSGGSRSAHRERDWTDGCIAVTNEEMAEIWATVEDGTPIEIVP